MAGVSLSTKGQEVLKEIFASYREGFIEANPGCNENDIERAFLSNCPAWAITKERRARLKSLINEIR